MLMYKCLITMLRLQGCMSTYYILIIATHITIKII